jgi:hypothetical protein
MSFKYKVRPYNNEDGEFTDYVTVDKTAIEKVFSDNYDADDSLKSFRTIAITDDRQQTIVVHYIKKGVCDIYFIPSDSNFYYFKKSTIELATQTVRLFLESKITDLTSLLNKLTEDNDFIRGDFFNKSFEYKVTKSKSRKEISWIWYALPLGLAFIILGIININHGASIFLFIIGLVLWLPGVIIHYQYYKDNHQLRVTLSRGNNIINVATPTLSKTFTKDDIKEILKVNSGFNRFAWGQYGFTRIEFKTGEILNLTCLMLDQLFIEDKFDGFNGKTLKTETLIPTLDKKTRL